MRQEYNSCLWNVKWGQQISQRSQMRSCRGLWLSGLFPLHYVWRHHVSPQEERTSLSSKFTKSIKKWMTSIECHNYTDIAVRSAFLKLVWAVWNTHVFTVQLMWKKVKYIFKTAQFFIVHLKPFILRVVNDGAVVKILLCFR